MVVRLLSKCVLDSQPGCQRNFASRPADHGCSAMPQDVLSTTEPQIAHGFRSPMGRKASPRVIGLSNTPFYNSVHFCRFTGPCPASARRHS